jgi:hypothetical protein
MGLPSAAEISVPRARANDPTTQVNTCAGCGAALPPKDKSARGIDDGRHTVLDCLKILSARVEMASKERSS